MIKSLLIAAFLLGASAQAKADVTCRYNYGPPMVMQPGDKEIELDLHYRHRNESILLSAKENGSLRVRRVQTGEAILDGKKIDVTYITKFQVKGAYYRIIYTSGDVLHCHNY